MIIDNNAPVTVALKNGKEMQLSLTNIETILDEEIFVNEAKKESEMQDKLSKIYKGEHTRWLHSCPCSDGNYITHLKSATKEDIELVLSVLPEQGNKTKIKVLKIELEKRG